MALTNLTYDAPFEPKVSRLFIFRPLWMIIEIFVFMIWAIWIGIVSFVHLWYMLILGRRSKTLWSRQMRFMRHCSKWNAYVNAFTDQRPDFIES